MWVATENRRQSFPHFIGRFYIRLLMKIYKNSNCADILLVNNFNLILEIILFPKSLLYYRYKIITLFPKIFYTYSIKLFLY